MRRIVTTLNLNNFMPAVCRESITAAADRWGAEYLEVTTPLIDRGHLWWNKSAIHRQIEGSAQVVYVDADMLVRYDCPSPFDLVPEDHFAMVRSNPRRLRNINYVDRWVKRVSKLTGLPEIDTYNQYCNAGMEVYSTDHHRDLFEWCMQYASDLGPKDGKVCLVEQTILSMKIAGDHLPFTPLPSLFNTCYVDDYPGVNRQGPMSTYIYHFLEVTRPLLDGVDWTSEDPGYHHVSALLDLIPNRRWSMTEVGTRAGELSSRVLAARPKLNLIIVDPYSDQPCDEPLREIRYRYWNAYRETDFADSRRQFLPANTPQGNKTHSRWPLNEVGRSSQDLIYLDSHYSRRSFPYDLVEWWKCLKPGGILCGLADGPGGPGLIEFSKNVAKQPIAMVSFGESKLWVVHKP